MAGNDDHGLGLSRRRFLTLAGGASVTALVHGCGDDGIGADADGTGSSGTGADGSATAPTTTAPTGADGTSTGPDGTGTTGTETGSDSTGDTDGAVCEDDGADLVAFDAEAVPLDDVAFPLAVMAGEMKPDSALLAVYIEDAQPRIVRIWRESEEAGMVALVTELDVTPSADGYGKVMVEDLCPGTWYSYAFLTPDGADFSGRSLIGRFRTALAEDALEPLTLAVTACNGGSLDWPAMQITANEDYDIFIHLGDMAYNDGAFTLEEYRDSWKSYMAVSGFKRAFAGAGLYCTWDDHEIDNNSNFDRETMDPMQLQKRQNAMDAYFELVPIAAEGPDYQLWRSFRWGLTAEFFVLDCRYERRPSMGLYMSQAQMDWLKQGLADSPCQFKVILNSVPITDMPTVWDVAANDRWDGYPTSRNELLDHINDNNIENIWFLGGDFHVCFVSRIGGGDDLASSIHEIAVTGGNQNPVPSFLLGLNAAPFSYGTTQARGLIITLDPAANTVNVRFIDPADGTDDHNETLTYN